LQVGLSRLFKQVLVAGWGVGAEKTQYKKTKIFFSATTYAKGGKGHSDNLFFEARFDHIGQDVDDLVCCANLFTDRLGEREQPQAEDDLVLCLEARLLACLENVEQSIPGREGERLALLFSIYKDGTP